MRDETFVKYMKEVYPNTYDSLVADFERIIKHKGVLSRRMKNE